MSERLAWRSGACASSVSCPFGKLRMSHSGKCESVARHNTSEPVIRMRARCRSRCVANGTPVLGAVTTAPVSARRSDSRATPVSVRRSDSRVTPVSVRTWALWCSPYRRGACIRLYTVANSTRVLQIARHRCRRYFSPPCAPTSAATHEKRRAGQLVADAPSVPRICERAATCPPGRSSGTAAPPRRR